MIYKIISENLQKIVVFVGFQISTFICIKRKIGELFPKLAIIIYLMVNTKVVQRSALRWEV